MTNLFKNIKTLKLIGGNYNIDMTSKIYLPELVYLSVDYSIKLLYFRDLNSLKHLKVKHWNKNVSFKEIFDPS